MNTRPTDHQVEVHREQAAAFWQQTLDAGRKAQATTEHDMRETAREVITAKSHQPHA